MILLWKREASEPQGEGAVLYLLLGNADITLLKASEPSGEGVVDFVVMLVLDIDYSIDDGIWY